ncbi:MAG: M56 family metallopeptidase [Phycisphaerales bacterium]
MSGWDAVFEQVAHALGHAVVQSLWQCAFVGALAAAIAMCTRRASVRYCVWCLGMLVSAGWFVLTFAGGLRVERVVEVVGLAGGGVGGMGAVKRVAGADTAVLPSASVAEEAASAGFLEIVALLWVAGFAVVSVRYVMQWRAAQRLRTRGLVSARAEWQTLYEDVRRLVGVSRRVCLRVSERARCPMVVGVLTPVVVVPASVLTMLSAEQVRMVLAHELAHVRRYDHVVNMAQVLIETVLFYHPVIWWMSRQARVEREHCCDDAAVRMCEDAVAYARALTELEEVRLQTRAVLGLQGGSLMKRVQRLVMDDSSRRGSVSVKVMSVVLVGAMIGIAACTTGMSRDDGVVYDSYEALRAAVLAGEISADEARIVYEQELLPESWVVSRCADERAYWVEELKTYGLSDERMAKTLDAMEREFEQRIEKDFRTRVLGFDGREVALAMYRAELERCKQEEGLSDEVAERMYAKRVEQMTRPARVVNLPDSSKQKDGEGVQHYLAISPKGDTVDGTPVRLVEGTQAAGVYEVKDGVPEGSAYKPGQRIEVTPGMSMPMYRAMWGKTAEEQWLEQYGEAAEPKPVELEVKEESMQQEGKLTPMDDDYWIHQGIRPLEAYDESFLDDC